MIKSNDIELKNEGDAFPEAYAAYYKKEYVGYLRLRGGRFTVHCPDFDHELVYMAHPKGRGSFDVDERDHYLHNAKEAIADWLDKHNKDAGGKT